MMRISLPRLFDVIDPGDRGTAAGLMNSVGWTGGFLAPTAVGLGSAYFGLSLAIASTAAVYLLVGLLAFLAARLAETQSFLSGRSIFSSRRKVPHREYPRTGPADMAATISGSTGAMSTRSSG